VFQIGSHLAEQRRRLGLTLAECESATMIRAKYLAALEEDRPDDLPDPAYVRIFLRGYATFLGLDAGVLLTEFDEHHGDVGLGDEHRLVSAEPPAAGRMAELGRWLVQRRGRSRRREAVSVAVVLAAILAVLYWLGETGGSRSSTPGPSTVPPTATRAGTPAPITRPGRPAAAVLLTLTGTQTGGSYVLVRRSSATGAVVYQGTVAPGASVRIRVTGSLWMRVGWAPSLRVLLGGRSVPLSGGTGDFTVTRAGVTSAR
jgi:transcriptional regulator with XRE-family HTH domain